MIKESMGLNFEIARRREVGKDNSGIPKQATRCTDEEVSGLLQEIWIKEIHFYNDTRYCINGGLFALEGYEVEESDFESKVFHGQLHPTVEDYNWYRGFAIKANGGKVLIFSGWMQPWREYGAPDPIVCLLGKVSRETVLGVIQSYCSGISNHIVKVRNALKVAKEAYDKAKENGASDEEAQKEHGIAYNNAMK